MNEGKLINLLKKLKADGKELSVKWDAGGDQAILTFEVNNIPIPNQDQDEFLSELSMLLIKKFTLPEVGEYYNEGGGVFAIDEEEVVTIEYKEYAYGDDYEKEEETEVLAEERMLEDPTNVKRLLDIFEVPGIRFYGAIRYLPDERNEFETSIYHSDKNKYLEEIEAFHQALLQQIFTIIEKKEIMHLDYSGVIRQNGVLLEELNQFQYWIDKNNTGKIKLFKEPDMF